MEDSASTWRELLLKLESNGWSLMEFMEWVLIPICKGAIMVGCSSHLLETSVEMDMNFVVLCRYSKICFQDISSLSG